MLPLTGCLEESSGGNRTIFKVDENAKKAESSRYGYGSGENPDGRKARKKKPGENPIEELNGEEKPPEELAVGENPVTEATETVGPTDPETSSTAMTEKEDPPKETSGGSTPVAQMIPGKSGQVYSPFAPGKPVDVSGYPPGTLMRCPYTGKEFKVP